MQQYLDILNKIIAEGHEHVARTKSNRISIFGEQVKYKLTNNEIPLVTTRKIYTKALIRELLWFISGNFNTKYLQEANSNIWKQWDVKREHVVKFVEDKIRIDSDEDKEIIINELCNQYLDSIGPMYGAMWRNAPVSNLHIKSPLVPLEDIPKDKLENYTKEYEEQIFFNPELKEKTNLEHYASLSYLSTVDQLNNLIINLKQRPYSSRHVVTAWVPEFIPFETLSPQENVLLGKGALAPCHAIFQCFVKPPKEENGKPRLSLLMYQR